MTSGDSDALKIGQTVIAIGNVLDEFRNTVTKGIVSGLNRHLQGKEYGYGNSSKKLRRPMPAINPGNSGGPLEILREESLEWNTATSFSG